MLKAREIRTKIASIKNTQKITRAMELVAASKMRKAQDRMTMSRPYASKICKVISHVSVSHAEYHHPYLQQRETIKRVGYIVVTTDRGLCGGLNVNLFRVIIADMKKCQDNDIDIDLCVIGRKGEVFFRRFGVNVLGVVDHLGNAPEVEDIIGIVKIMLDQYDQQHIDAMYLVTNEFVNTMAQQPVIRLLLPLKTEEAELEAGYWDYIYEPDDSKDLLEMLLVRYIESQVYQAVIENIACEQSARMVAMKNATENAGQLINELKLTYNKARQANITREIAEIIAGTAAAIE